MEMNCTFRARTQILKQQDAKDREKYVMKFIKIMKHLRKINNYNSYLAILSALGNDNIHVQIDNDFNCLIKNSRFSSDKKIRMAKEHYRRIKRILRSY